MPPRQPEVGVAERPAAIGSIQVKSLASNSRQSKLSRFTLIIEIVSFSEPLTPV